MPYLKGSSVAKEREKLSLTLFDIYGRKLIFSGNSNIISNMLYWVVAINYD